jgi:hypothetical protein
MGGTCVSKIPCSNNSVVSLIEKKSQIQKLTPKIQPSIISNQTLTNFTSNNTMSKITEDSFEGLLLKEINLIRSEPQKYANKLKELIPNIRETNGKLYFHFENKQKILITKGEELFQETIGILNKTKPMNKLSWNHFLKINIPSHIKKITNGHIENLMISKRREYKNQFAQITFTIDIFSNPILSVIFQITDEMFNSERRNAILNPSFSQYAVSYREDITEGKFFSISTFA